MQHTPLVEPTGYHAAFNLAVLGGDYSGVVAIVHSHPESVQDGSGGSEYYYNPLDEDYLLYPSQTHERDGATQGDWITYDHYAGLVSADGGDASALSFYIIGFDGQQLVINQYGWEDRETNTAESGDPVDPSTEACTC